MITRRTSSSVEDFNKTGGKDPNNGGMPPDPGEGGVFIDWKAPVFLLFPDVDYLLYTRTQAAPHAGGH